MTTADHRAAELAAKQHGVMTRAQLLELGASARTIARRIDEGRWGTISRGAYLHGGFERSMRARLMAATLLVPDSAASHLSAARLHELEPLPPDTGVGDITAPGRRQRTGGDFRLHCVASLEETDVTLVDHIPCTSIARTIVDLAAVLRPVRLATVLDRSLSADTSLNEVIARLTGRQSGAAKEPR